MVAQARPRKHIPLRTCVGCRRTSAKREFVRIVRTPEGRVMVDPTGKRSGRGAYLCADPSCWQAALRRGRLDRALRTQIGQEDRQALLAYAEALNNREG
ncbi:hypothetical protein HRbin25_00239 [bacterium HR25]|jgi:predicted RNA-binding protein YlxR (DUF448 family)|nr:hypothetical protein HRbin25_00239 [bacterium HR25]